MAAVDSISPTITQVSPTHLRVHALSHPAVLAPVRTAMETFLEQIGFDFNQRGQLVLVVNEAMANVMRHAYGGAADRPIELDAVDHDGVLTLTLRDWGNGRLPPEPPCEKTDPLRPGGLGLICLRQYLDQITFEPRTDGMTLVMKRNKPTPKQDQPCPT